MCPRRVPLLPIFLLLSGHPSSPAPSTDHSQYTLEPFAMLEAPPSSLRRPPSDPSIGPTLLEPLPNSRQPRPRHPIHTDLLLVSAVHPLCHTAGLPWMPSSLPKRS